MAFKLKGSPMQRNFGIKSSPTKDHEEYEAPKYTGPGSEMLGKMGKDLYQHPDESWSSVDPNAPTLEEVVFPAPSWQKGHSDSRSTYGSSQRTRADMLRDKHGTKNLIARSEARGLAGDKMEEAMNRLVGDKWKSIRSISIK